MRRIGRRRKLVAPQQHWMAAVASAEAFLVNGVQSSDELEVLLRLKFRPPRVSRVLRDMFLTGETVLEGRSQKVPEATD